MALGLALLAAACGDAEAVTEGSAGVDPFDGSVPSLEALGRVVLDALVRGDVSALERVRLTEHEHNEVVWPELPASAPEVNFPVDYAWSNIENRNLRSLRRIVPLYEGERLDFKLVDCRGDTRSFETFEVLTDCWVVFVREDTSDLYEAQVFKDVLVRAGGHKIFRYYDEEPERYGGEGAGHHGGAAR